MKAFVQHQYKDSDKLVLQALMPFIELNSKALFTQKVLYNDVISDRNLTEVEGNADYYQRRLDPKRLKEIKRYIYNAILDEKDKVAVSALFPTAMILAVEYEDIPQITGDLIDIALAKGQRMFIVDGQHRLMAMRQLYEELSHSLVKGEDDKYILDYLTTYRFNCTILINYDIWEQGQVFVNVNFKQKPVNRSLYYDVYGAEYIESNDPKHLERNKIYLAHELTRFMNEYSMSPFYKNIRMLGTGKGYVSQSFFVEALLPLFKDSGIWYFDGKQKETYRVLDTCKAELYNFYSTVAKVFKKYWGVDKNNRVNFICKTTGVGALTRLMSLLHRQMDVQVINLIKDTKPEQNCDEYISELTKYLTPLMAQQDVLFGPESTYGKTGGKGIEDTLYKKFVSILREAGLLKKDLSNKARYFKFEIVKSSISQSYITYLEGFGITGIEQDLYIYMNNHLPSEVDALGTHCRIDEVEDLMVSNVEYSDEKEEAIVSGTFLCTVDISFDNDDNVTFKSDFPGSFTAHYVRINHKWEIQEDGSRIFVNTDSYYR